MTGHIFRYTYAVDMEEGASLEWLKDLEDSMQPFGKVKLVGQEVIVTPDSPALVSDVVQSHADLDGRIQELEVLVNDDLANHERRIAQLEEILEQTRHWRK
jgi:hypothetical protein